MIKTLLNPNHVLSDCDNISDIDGQRMATVLGKHIYGFKPSDPNKPVVKVLGMDANDDVRWSNGGVPGGGLPPSTPEDEGKVLVVGDDGQPEWADLPFGRGIAYSVDRATQANWNIDTLYASTQFYISDNGDNDGVDYYLDDQDRKAGYEVLEDHIYQVNFNCNASCASTSNNVWEGSIYITGPQDQNWYFQLDGSQVIDVSLTGSTIIHCTSDGVLYFNARLNGSYLGTLPTLTLSKVSIVDLTSAIGGSGGGSGPQYRPGTGIEIEDDVISIDPTEAQEKLTAGPNIDIIDNIISTEKVVVTAGQNVSITSSSDPSTRTITYTVNSSGGGGVQPVQSNWAESDSQSLAYIQNKPQNLVQDADYTHTDNNFSDSDKSKLDNIEAGAEVNVQSNWNEVDTSSDAYILNKPTLAAVATSGSYTDLTDQPTIPSGTQLLPSATSADENKVLTVDSSGYPGWVLPSNEIPTVTSNDNGKVLTAIYSSGTGSYSWQPGMSSEDVFVAEYGVTQWADINTAFLANKALFAYYNGHTYVMSDMVYSGGLQSVTFANVRSSRTGGSDNDSVQVWFVKAQSTGTTWSAPDHSAGYLVTPPDSGDEGKVLTVKDTLGVGSNFEWAAAPSMTQVQSDWGQTDNTAVDYIKNKPQNLVQDASYVHTDNNFTNSDVSKLGGIESGAEVNVQSDWAETDNTADSYIQNKPAVANLIAGTGIQITETAQGIVISLA